MFHPPLRLRAAGRLAVVFAAGALLSACSGFSERLPSVTSLVSTYKIDVVQGNVVTREQVQALRPGMAREQVRNVLGSPLLMSVFHANRWDYVFTFRRQGQEPQQRRVAVFFKGDVMERFEADELPSETEFVASLDVKRRATEAPPLQATEEQLKAFEARNKPAVPASTPPSAPATSQFPPLESSQ